MESRVWWLDYSVDGKRHRESSGERNKTEAQRILRRRIADRETGKVIGRPDRVLLAEYVKDKHGKEKLIGGLRALVETQYDLDGLRSKERIVQCWNQLEKFFLAGTKVSEITPTRIDDYAKARLAEGAARQTANNELAALRRGFKLAIEKGLLSTMPIIKLPKVDNARSGFLEDGDFAVLLMELPTQLQPIIRFLRFTGWRVMEALNLTWNQVDRDGQVIRLSSTVTKGKRARLFPFGLAPELKAVLDAQWQVREGPFVFQNGGRRIGYGSLLNRWRVACKRAGCPGQLMHDLRRTAARDFRRFGVSEGEIMALCGWKTRAMFDRYNIIDEADLASAVAKRFNGKVTAKSEASTATPDAVSSSATT